MACEYRPRKSRKELHAIAPDESARLELTEALSSADDGRPMRKLLHTTLQALIDADSSEHSGADPTSAPTPPGRTSNPHRILLSRPF